MYVLSLFVYFYTLVQLTVCQDANNQDYYANDPNIYELTPSTFDKVILNSNYTSIVKFYAPWCGYCKQLYPTYTKLGKLLHKDGQYAVNVASVNCDKSYNKELCSKYKVSGFPTLMVFRPPKYDKNRKSKSYRHAIEPYNGQRNLKSMDAYITSTIKNYVKRYANINSESLKEWLATDTETKKILVISKAQAIPPLLKTLAIDFMESIQIGFISAKSLDSRTIEVNGKEVHIPEGDLPLLMLYENGKLKKYAKTDKLNDKLKISEWIVEETNVTPSEGPLSALDINVRRAIREGKKKTKSTKKKDKKSNANNKAKNKNKSKSQSKTIVHDEL